MHTAPTPPAPSRWPAGISWRTVVAASLIFWLMPLAYILLGKFLDDLIVVYVAILLSTVMHPVVTWLRHRKVPRGLSILGLYLLVAALLGFAALLAVPLFTQETQHLVGQWPRYQEQLNGPLSHLGIHLGRSGGNVGTGAQLSSFVGILPAAVINISALLVNLVVMFVLSFFFTSDAHFAERLVAFVVPPGYRAGTNTILSEIGGRMGRWVLGQLGIVIYYAAAFSLGLSVLKVPYALSVGVVTGLLEIVPFVGGFVGLGLALLVALAQNPTLLVPVIVLYLLVTNVEAHLIVPNLYGKVIQLHPATVVISLLLGARAFGLVGALIAMPLAAGLQVLFEHLYLHDVIEAAEGQDASKPHTAIPAYRTAAPGVVRWPRRSKGPSRPAPDRRVGGS
ncbi:MAG: hypothetical protein NVSMB65_17480 [Chloroflexota bacterium]